MLVIANCQDLLRMYVYMLLTLHNVFKCCCVHNGLFTIMCFLQSLMFLVRDCSYPYEHSYGHEGGQEYLDKILRVSSYTMLLCY